jgi:Protein of unknown function (DUF3467)
MTSGPGREPERDRPRAAKPQDLQWDLSAARSSYCTVASAKVAPTHALISFGVPRSREGAPRELEVEVLHRVSLNLIAAEQLRRLLARVLAEHDSQ